MARQKDISARRSRVRKILAVQPDLTNEQIGERLGVGKDTIRRDRDALDAQQPIPNIQDPETGKPVAGAEEGNTRALQHGLHSETKLAPLRIEHIERLARTYPWMEGERISVEANRRAMIESGGTWLEAQNGIVRDREGNVFPVVTVLDKMLTASERWIEKAESERAKRAKDDAPSMLSQLQGGDSE